MKTNKLLSLLTASILSATLLVGCTAEPDYGLKITAIAESVSYEKGQEYAETLTVGPESQPVRVTTELMTVPVDEEDMTTEDYDDVTQASAEMMGAAGLMKVSAQIAGEDVDIIISDYENAQRLSNSESFLPLDEVFTPEELAEIDESLYVSYEQVDDEGNPTGEMLEPTGIDVTHIPEFSTFLGAEQIVCHVVANAINIDASKEYILSLLD